MNLFIHAMVFISFGILIGEKLTHSKGLNFFFKIEFFSDYVSNYLLG